jgi:GNAT superfamily N-acetyltransferase
MLPVPERRDERVPGLRHLESALADRGVFVFAAFDGRRPAGFVSGYRFPSLTKACDLVYIHDVAPTDRGRGVGRKLIDRVLASAEEKAWPRPGSATRSVSSSKRPSHRATKRRAEHGKTPFGQGTVAASA